MPPPQGFEKWKILLYKFVKYEKKSWIFIVKWAKSGEKTVFRGVYVQKPENFCACGAIFFRTWGKILVLPPPSKS